MALSVPPKYCACCGQPLVELAPNNLLSCGGCGKPVYHGPTVLVSALVFSDNQLLLIKRGLAPYPGKWAAPGGFVDPNESLEAAAARETLEESGVKVDPGCMVPHAVLSLPSLNQVYVCFVVTLESPQRACPCLPESLDARWFTLADYPHESMWDPVLNFDIEDIFRQQAIGKLNFYQRTDDKLRKFGPYSS